MQDIADQRSRDLECDRMLSAGLCMATAAMALTGLSARFPAYADLLTPRPNALIAPFGAMAGFVAEASLMRLAAFVRRRAVAAAILLFAAFNAAVVVLFAHQALSLFLSTVTPARSAAMTGFVIFGCVAAAASHAMAPTPAHLRRSAIITIVALFMAALDADGIFACILAVMGFCFFTFWKRSEPA